MPHHIATIAGIAIIAIAVCLAAAIVVATAIAYGKDNGHLVQPKGLTPENDTNKAELKMHSDFIGALTMSEEAERLEEPTRLKLAYLREWLRKQHHR